MTVYLVENGTLLVDGEAVTTGTAIALVREMLRRYLAIVPSSRGVTSAQRRADRLAVAVEVALFDGRQKPAAFELSSSDLAYILSELDGCWMRGDLVWIPERGGWWSPGHVVGRGKDGLVRANTMDDTTGQELTGRFRASQLAHRDQLRHGTDKPQDHKLGRRTPRLYPINSKSGRQRRVEKR